jgi:hypothetical protein
MQKPAAEGMVFERAFTASPTCVSSRAVIMSGLMPAQSGALPNHSGLTPGLPMPPTFLIKAGYRVAHFGRSHYEPKASYPDVEWVPSDTVRGTLDAVPGSEPRLRSARCLPAPQTTGRSARANSPRRVQPALKLYFWASMLRRCGAAVRRENVSGKALQY